MFKQVFKSYFTNKFFLSIFVISIVAITSFLTISYILASKYTFLTFATITTAIILFILVANWVIFVMMPRKRIRKNQFEPEALRFKKECKIIISDQDATKAFIYGRSFAVSIVLVINLIPAIIFLSI